MVFEPPSYLKMVCHISTSDIHASHSVRKGKAFIDWHSMSHSVSGVQNDPCCSTRRVETEDCLRRDEESRDIQRLKEDFCSSLTVLKGV